MSSVPFCKFIFMPLLLAFISGFSAYGQAPTPLAYPRMAGYVSIVHPLVTFNKDETRANFTDSYVVGFPTGLNLWKTSKIGFSMELIPFVRAENGSSRMNNLLFHPGVLASLGNGFTFIGRAAFETSGRYGVTPVINKVVKRNPGTSWFVAVPAPIRFGNGAPASLTPSFQFGIGF